MSAGFNLVQEIIGHTERAIASFEKVDDVDLSDSEREYLRYVREDIETARDELEVIALRVQNRDDDV